MALYFLRSLEDLTLPSCHRIQRLTWPSWWLTQLLLLQVGAATVSAAQPRTELLNICMDVKPRKEKPRPENKLRKRKNPCCFANITWEAQKGISHLYRLNWDHCGQTAPACKQYLIQDTYQYECS